LATVEQSSACKPFLLTPPPTLQSLNQGANNAMRDSADLALCLVKANSTLSSTSNDSEKSQALLKAQEEFQAIQYPRAKESAIEGMNFLHVTFYKSAKERVEWCKKMFMGES